MLSFLSFQSKACASVLLEQVCRQLNLLESDYFGLEYTDGNTRYWLDLEKPMNRQVSLGWSWERRGGWFLLLQNGGFWCGYQAYKGIGCGRDAWSGCKDYCIYFLWCWRYTWQLNGDDYLVIGRLMIMLVIWNVVMLLGQSAYSKSLVTYLIIVHYEKEEENEYSINDLIVNYKPNSYHNFVRVILV